MTKRTKTGVIAMTSLMGLIPVGLVLRMGIAFFAAQTDSIQKSGTWENDPMNWHRAFNEEPPAGVQVIHSKYWRSDHFTVEFMYFFEVQATPEWRDAFLKKKGLDPVPPPSARSSRSTPVSSDAPGWFAPDPVELYDVWDRPGYYGSVWINKTNGHIFFYDVQL